MLMLSSNTEWCELTLEASVGVRASTEQVLGDFFVTFLASQV